MEDFLLFSVVQTKLLGFGLLICQNKTCEDQIFGALGNL